MIVKSVIDRKSTRLNSSHVAISYAVFCFTNKFAGPRASGVDDDIRCDRAAGGAHRAHLRIVHIDGDHFSVALNLHAAALRCARKSHGYAIGIGNAVNAAESSGEDAVCRDARRETRGFVWGQALDGYAVGALQLQIPLEGGNTFVGAQEEQVTVLPEVNRRTDNVFELCEQRNRFLG